MALATFLAHRYGSTGRDIAITLALALLKCWVLVKVFISLYLLNIVMDQVDTLHVGRYWTEVLCCTITFHLLKFLLKFLVDVFVNLSLLNILMDHVDTLHIG